MKLILLASLYAIIAAEFVSYDGFKVYELHPSSQEQLDIIASYATNNHFDFWSGSKILELPTTIMVHPESQPGFIHVLESNDISYNVLIQNVQKTIDAEGLRQSQSPKVYKGRITFTQYHRFAEIGEYLDQLAEEYPDIVSLEFFQSTYDSHALSVIKIGNGTRDRPVILIEGTIHAREWIAPATCLYIIQQLVENEENRHMIENIDWYIIPVLNPDGYEYSHTTARLWRKTRLPNGDSDCVGVDGNRNFDYHWMEVGASSNACDETYAGERTFNQLETLGFSNVAYEYRNQTKLFLSIHSYGQYILYPWGYTDEEPEDVEELHELATQIEAAIAEVNGTRYTIGTTYNTLYGAAGISPDWVKGYLGVDLSYTVELPGGGEYGFDLPASRIADVVTETFEGIKTAHAYIENKFVVKNNN